MDKFQPQYAPVAPTTISQRCEEIERKTVAFCESHVRPELDVITNKGAIPPHLMQSLKDTGWMGLLISRSYGGMGLDCLARTINVEYVARESPDLGAILQIAQLGTGSILEFGSEEQKLKWLPAMARGDRICTIAITEEGSGSHVLGMSTIYEETADGFILNGEKCFIGNCSIANLHLVYARKRNDKVLSAFIVEGEREGVDNNNPYNHVGLRAFPLGRLRLNNVEVPKDNLLGKQHDGLKIAYYVIGYHGRHVINSDRFAKRVAKKLL